ncbi:MAG: radical SAM protein [Pseudomonadota bacterium]
MTRSVPRPRVVHKAAMVPIDLKILAGALLALFESENRRIRRDKGLNLLDGLFNLLKACYLDEALRKQRHSVKFGRYWMLDCTVPPYPSPAFDKRMRNYMNNLDITEAPSGIVSISTTNCCPYSCAFCSTNAKRNFDADTDEELLKRTISSIENLGTPYIILHGGEPMYRYDRFLRLVKHVDDDTCLWMFTTGWGVTPERAIELKNSGMFGVWVSLDHYDAAVHNRLRGNPDAFDNACRAIQCFREAGLYTCLSLVPPPDLCEPEGFKRYYDFARELGVAEIRVLERKPSGREACHGVTPHSPVLARLHKELFRDPAYQDHPPLSGLSTWLEKDEALGCQCRFEYLFITAKGDVQPCEVSEVSFGNIRTENFADIFQRARVAFQRPSTGCIPMVMFPEIREYIKVSETMSSRERAELATAIVTEFQERGDIPGALKPIWSLYQRRLRGYRERRAKVGGRGRDE